MSRYIWLNIWKFKKVTTCKSRPRIASAIAEDCYILAIQICFFVILFVDFLKIKLCSFL